MNNPTDIAYPVRVHIVDGLAFNSSEHRVFRQQMEKIEPGPEPF
jgi:hypothetical protein